MVLKNLLQGSNGEADIRNRLMDMERGEERVRCMERVTGKLTLSYENRYPMRISLWLRKLKQGLCITLEGGDGEVDRREVQKEGDICIPKADSC